MSRACCSQFGEIEPRRGAAIAGRTLSYAATPIFAAMTVWTSLCPPSDMMCMSGQGASRLSGMAAMYLLMSVVHLTPWLGLIEEWRNGAQP